MDNKGSMSLQMIVLIVFTIIILTVIIIFQREKIFGAAEPIQALIDAFNASK